MPCTYCVLCGNRDKSVSYHAFPKKVEIRKQWLAFCGISEHVLNTATRLCSNHFREEVLKKKVSRGTCTKYNAVPSIHIKKRKMSQQSSSFIDEVNCSSKKKYIVIDNVNVDCIPKNIESIQSNCQTPPKAESQFCVDIGTPDSATTAERSLKVANDGLSTPPRDEATQCSNFQTPTKAVPEPRFVGAIRTPHLATPRKARRVLELAKRTITQQRRKIKTLQQSRNKLVARITTMKDVLKHLKQKNLISEMAAENLTVIEPSF